MIARQDAIRIIHENLGKIKAFSVTSISIFGSVARNESSEDSDIDILVEFDPDAEIGLFEFIRLQTYLGEIFDCRVDLVTMDALRDDMKNLIMRDLIQSG